MEPTPPQENDPVSVPPTPMTDPSSSVTPPPDVADEVGPPAQVPAETDLQTASDRIEGGEPDGSDVTSQEELDEVQDVPEAPAEVVSEVSPSEVLPEAPSGDVSDQVGSHDAPQ